MTAEIVPIVRDEKSLEVDPVGYMATVLHRAKGWLSEAQSIDEVRNAKAVAVGYEAVIREKEMAFDAQLSATELVRRCEHRIVTLVRDGQAAGIIAGQGHRSDLLPPNVATVLEVVPRKDWYGNHAGHTGPSGVKDLEASPVDFDAAIEMARGEGDLSRPNVVRKLRGLMTSGTPEWYTPQHVLERTIALLGAIGLDPCSNSHDTPNVPAERHFTEADDGLAQQWKGTVYLNPPYGKTIGEWTDKLRSEWVDGSVTEAVALVPARTDTAWWAGLRDHPRCFVRGRLKFSESENSAPFPSAIFYLGDRLPYFVRAFSDLGDIFVRASA